MAGYDAFISYSHAKDKTLASALQSVLQKIGKPWYARRSLPNAEGEMSTLGAELERALAYLEILKVRMGDRLDVQTDVAESLRGDPGYLSITNLRFVPPPLITIAKGIHSIEMRDTSLGRFPYPRFRNDPAAIPRAVVEHELANLGQVARAQAQT